MDLLSLIPFVGKIIDRIFPDPAQADAAKLEILKMQQNGELAKLAADTDLAKGQLAINQAEAASSSLFVSGWRPFIGWVCGGAFAYFFILQPFLAFTLAAFGQSVSLPEFDTETLNTVLFGMLGLGTMRSAEKITKSLKSG